MKKNVFNFLLALLTCLFFSVLAVNVKASEVISTVSIDNAQIVSKERNKFELVFVISNREKVQTNLKYSVNLTKEPNGPVIDSYIDHKSFTIKENEKVNNRIFYTAPNYLRGDFYLSIEIQRESGMSLAFFSLGNVKLKGTGDYIWIDPHKCELSIEGDREAYSLEEGIDVKSEEDLAIKCVLKNESDKDKELSSNFNVYLRSRVGQEQVTESMENNKINISAGEEKEVELLAPRVNKPQAYHGELIFSQNDKIVSNSVYYHYVEKGESATINSVQINSDVYTKGDNAEIEVVWTPSADGFVNARYEPTKINPSLKISAVDGSGKECADEFSTELSKGGVLKHSLKIKNDCLNPIITALIKDDSGNVLDSKTAGVRTNSEKIKLIESMDEIGETGLESQNLYIAIAIGFVLLFIVLAVFVMNSKKSASIFLLGFIAAALFMIKGLTVLANSDTGSTTDLYSVMEGGTIYSKRITVSLESESENDPQILLPNQAIIFSFGKTQDAICTNEVPVNDGFIKIIHDDEVIELEDNQLVLPYLTFLYAAEECGEQIHEIGYVGELELPFYTGNSKILDFEKTFYYKVPCPDDECDAQCGSAEREFSIGDNFPGSYSLCEDGQPFPLVPVLTGESTTWQCSSQGTSDQCDPLMCTATREQQACIPEGDLISDNSDLFCCEGLAPVEHQSIEGYSVCTLEADCMAYVDDTCVPGENDEVIVENNVIIFPDCKKITVEDNDDMLIIECPDGTNYTINVKYDIQYMGNGVVQVICSNGTKLTIDLKDSQINCDEGSILIGDVEILPDGKILKDGDEICSGFTDERECQIPLKPSDMKSCGGDVNEGIFDGENIDNNDFVKRVYDENGDVDPSMLCQNSEDYRNDLTAYPNPDGIVLSSNGTTQKWNWVWSCGGQQLCRAKLNDDFTGNDCGPAVTDYSFTTLEELQSLGSQVYPEPFYCSNGYNVPDINLIEEDAEGNKIWGWTCDSEWSHSGGGN